MPPDRPPPPTRGELERLASRIVSEKLRVLRLIRALDRAGVSPEDLEAMAAPLVRLAEYDDLLTQTLATLYCENPEDSASGDVIEQLLQIGEHAGDEVLDSLPPERREDFVRAQDEVAASEPEVWHEVEALRRRVTGAPSRAAEEPRQGPLSGGEVAERAGRVVGALAHGRRGALPGQKRARSEEWRELPSPDAPLAMWFARLPDSWREAIGMMHDIEPGEGGRVSPMQLVKRLTDRRWLRRFVAERLGDTERELLQDVLENVIGLEGEPELQAMFDVPWDWRKMLPPTSGGRLRAAGLVHVGKAVQTKVALVPPGLQEAVTDALRHVARGR
jgi:hypothetical protein